MKEGYIIRDQSKPHYITATVVDWIDVFSRKSYRDTIIECFDFCIKNKGMILFGYVIMSNHIHMIIQSEDEKLSELLRDFKKFTAKTILEQINTMPSIHNGSRLVITPDLKLFITTGDAANQTLPQNTSSLNGKILRLNLDGTIPADNPVAGNPYWSFGLRNTQGLVFANNILYSSEHGASSDDEINIIEKGRNYGWPNVEGFCNTSNDLIFCPANNVREPIKAWTPTIAVCGLDYYNNDLIPQWKNSLLLVALKESRLYQLKLDATFTSITSTTEYFAGRYGRMRDVCISPAGNVYICTSNGGNNDRIIVVKKQ